MRIKCSGVVVFPVHTGMNRWPISCRKSRAGVPHAYGDEPYFRIRIMLGGHVFPLHTGMNRANVQYGWFLKGVPRMHGDEPRAGMLYLFVFPVHTGMNRAFAGGRFA